MTQPTSELDEHSPAHKTPSPGRCQKNHAGSHMPLTSSLFCASGLAFCINKSCQTQKASEGDEKRLQSSQQCSRSPVPHTHTTPADGHPPSVPAHTRLFAVPFILPFSPCLFFLPVYFYLSSPPFDLLFFFKNRLNAEDTCSTHSIYQCISTEVFVICSKLVKYHQVLSHEPRHDRLKWSPISLKGSEWRH